MLAYEGENAPSLLVPEEEANLYHWTTKVSQLNLYKHPGSYFINGR
jgi:hypothetical protein